MTEAHRLNMVGGHFIWMWIDTSSSTGYFHQASVPVRHSSKSEQQRQSARKSNNSDNGTKTTDESQKSTDKMNTVPSTSRPASQKIAPRPESGSAGKSALEKNGAKVSAENGEQSTKVDFSQGFDPFRVLQRQDEHTMQHYQERTAQRDNKQTPANRLILGLRSENTHTENDDENARSKKNRRSNSKKGKAVNGTESTSLTQSQSQNRTTNRHKNIEKTIHSSNSSSSNSSKISITQAERTANNSNKNNNKKNTKNNSNTDNDDDDDDVDGGDKISNFILNQTSTAKNSIHSKYRNFSDDNLDDFIDNNSFNENYNNLKLNSNKRTSTANGSISSSFVNFHQFKDFPVGLLVLRPIRMNVDRHFIRAAVRLFAATWEKINGSQAIGNPMRLRAAAAAAASLSSPSSASATSQSRRTQPNRSALATLYNAKKLGNEMHGRKLRRKRNIFTINQLLTVAMENRSTKMSTTSSDTVVAIKQVNSSLLLKDISGNSDNDNLNISIRHINNMTDVNELGIQRISNGNISSSSINSVDNNKNKNKNNDSSEQFMQFNSSSTSDLSNSEAAKSSTKYSTIDGVSLTNVNVSFNRKFSGLWKQNSKNKSNISSLNSQRHEAITVATAKEAAVTTTTEAATLATVLLPFALSNVTNQRAIPFNRNDLSAESIARQASQSIVQNFFGFANHLQDIRRPSNKRQNAWWSTKKESTTSTTSTTVSAATAAALVQSKRPQYDTNQLANAQHTTDPDPTENQIKCATPSYSGGCYGTSTAQDIKNAEFFSR